MANPLQTGTTQQDLTGFACELSHLISSNHTVLITLSRQHQDGSDLMLLIVLPTQV